MPVTEMTFKVQPDAGSETTFAHITGGKGYFAVDYLEGAVKRDILRFHPRGVSGNITVRDQPSGRPIILRCMIVDDLGIALALFVALTDGWRGAPCTVTSPAGTRYTKCNLVDARILSTHADGSTTPGNVELEFEASFTKDSDF